MQRSRLWAFMYFDTLMDGLEAELLSKTGFGTKRVQIGPKSISSMPPWLKFRKDFEFRMQTTPKPQTLPKHHFFNFYFY